ncbi:MAG: DUF2974 domain-containing protein [Clostridia bacterium]|nr:DUF2974 domain-containing protein [Clostridia bacterium]
MGYTDNEMRNFTQIAYADLTKGYEALCASHPGKTSFSIAELKQASLDAGVKPSQLKSLNCLTDAQMQNWTISGIHDTNSSNGFYACIIETSPGNAAVGFRGSENMGSLDNVVNDWTKADLGLVNSTCTNQQAEVNNFLEKYKTQLNGYDSLAMAGHSLGGNLAEYATIVSVNYGLNDNITQCMSMDGPGFSDEFINEHRAEIEAMSGVMKHPRWSFVGTMLNDLPGVDYRYVQVENKGDDKYNSFTRHDTKYLVYDENGNLVDGEQDGLSKVTSVISEGVDHLPKPIGDAIIGGISAIWIGAMWVKEQMFENGHLTDAGKLVLASAIVIVGTIGIIPTVAIAIQTIAAIAVISFVALGAIAIYEIARDAIISAATFIAETFGKICEWGKNLIEDLKKSVVDLINKIKEWWDRMMNPGSGYASAHPDIHLNTDRMNTYAAKLASLSGRAKTLDRDMNSYYWQLLIEWDAIPRLAKLLKVGIGLDFAYRLDKCANYLRETAADFENVEKQLSNI